jgi:hypothetical protein
MWNDLTDTELLEQDEWVLYLMKFVREHYLAFNMVFREVEDIMGNIQERYESGDYNSDYVFCVIMILCLLSNMQLSETLAGICCNLAIELPVCEPDRMDEESEQILLTTIYRFSLLPTFFGLCDDLWEMLLPRVEQTEFTSVNSYWFNKDAVSLILNLAEHCQDSEILARLVIRVEVILQEMWGSGKRVTQLSAWGDFMDWMHRYCLLCAVRDKDYDGNLREAMRNILVWGHQSLLVEIGSGAFNICCMQMVARALSLLILHGLPDKDGTEYLAIAVKLLRMFQSSHVFRCTGPPTFITSRLSEDICSDEERCADETSEVMVREIDQTQYFLVDGILNLCHLKQVAYAFASNYLKDPTFQDFLKVRMKSGSVALKKKVAELVAVLVADNMGFCVVFLDELREWLSDIEPENSLPGEPLG